MVNPRRIKFTAKMLEAQGRVAPMSLGDAIIDRLNSDDLPGVETVAFDLGTSKATLGYWMLKLHIVYERVAYYDTEHIYVLDETERALIDQYRATGVVFRKADAVD